MTNDEIDALDKAIEQAVGGTYQMPDGRGFWIDRAVAREIVSRVIAALRARIPADDGKIAIADVVAWLEGERKTFGEIGSSAKGMSVTFCAGQATAYRDAANHFRAMLPAPPHGGEGGE